MPAKEFNADFMERVRVLFEEKGTLIKPNPVQWSNIVAHPEYYLRSLPFTIEERTPRESLFEYVFKGAAWTYTLQIELKGRDDLNSAGKFYDRVVYEVDFSGDGDAFDSDMIAAKLMV